MRRRGRRLATALIAAPLLVTAACSGNVEGFQGASSGPNEVRLLQQPWGDLVVENQIVRLVLGDLGYEVEVQQLSVPIGAQALANGQLDAYLGNWWPSQRPAYKEHLANGSVEVLGTLVTGTKYAPAVPKYVVEKYGIDSFTELDKHADLFGRKFLGIEPGTPGNQYITDAIAQDAYGLGDWQLVESSTAAMLAEVNRRVQDRKPVVFLGWKPHWMNVQWDLVYLKDPKDVWPGAGKIRVVGRDGLRSEKPEITQFLSQMKVDPATASDWIYQLSKKGRPAADIARDWIRSHPDKVAHWLRGVDSFNESRAVDS